MKGEPPHPKAEFRTAIAGPLSSFFLSALFSILSMNAAGGTRALIAYLAQINFIIAVFNLIPGFPMDGGRILRSAIWKKKKDFFTRPRRLFIFSESFPCLPGCRAACG